MKIGSATWKETIVAGAREYKIHVQPGQVEQFARYANILNEWNQKINLTTIVDPLEMAIKHFLDAILPYDYIKPHKRLLDVGSGAGFPGMALKIMLPALQVTLVEATRKKVNFLKHVIRELGLEQVEAIHSRIENLNQHVKPEYDVIVSRAFSDLPKFVQLAVPYLAANGHLITYKARGFATEISKLHKTLRGIKSLRTSMHQYSDIQIKTIPFQLPELNLSRTIILMQI